MTLMMGLSRLEGLNVSAAGTKLGDDWTDFFSRIFSGFRSQWIR